MRTFECPLGDMHDFSSKEAQYLLHNKFVVVIGDSIYRSMYKDLIYILQKDEMLTLDQLKEKGKETFANDCRVEFDGLHPGTDFCEVRQYRTSHHLVRFYFITRAYSSYVESILNDFKAGVESGLTPDVIIINSCIWDLNRYHDNSTKEPPLPKAIREYRQNLEKLFAGLDDVLPSGCLVIWDTAMPIRETVTGKLFKNCTPMDVIHSNFYSASIACCYQFDVLDLHYSFRFLEQYLHKDGIHWNNWVHRCITKLLLTHMADAWGVELQKRKPQIDFTGIDWNGNIEEQSPSSRLPFPQGPRQPLPLASGSPFSQFNPFAQHHSSYGSRTEEGFEYVPENAYVNGPGDGFEYGHGPQPCPGPLHLGNGPYFQHNGNYSHEPGDGYEYEQGPPPHPGHLHLRNVPHIQHNVNCSHGPRDGFDYGQGGPPFAGHPNPSHESYLQYRAEVISGPMDGYGHEQCPLPYPGQLQPGHEPYSLGSANYANGPVDEYGYEQCPPPYPGQLCPDNDPYSLGDANFANGPVDGYEDGQGVSSYPGQLYPDNDPYSLGDATYASGPTDGYEDGQGVSSYPGPLNPSNDPDFQHHANYARGPMGGCEDDQGPPHHLEEIHPGGFPAPGPNEEPWPLPGLPHRPPRRARGGRCSGPRMRRQPSYSQRHNAHPYAGSWGGSGNPQHFGVASFRGSRPWQRGRSRRP
ncbi:PC-esterase domain-containing protein 1A-like [Elgaria multicarinata webbii]|uniref:PC-esterase domain-containing protein 1A-like n=1 Tax=Elgaria multicarinata webbii TaxID=159646 RepID=UPI002FCD2808